MVTVPRVALAGLLLVLSLAKSEAQSLVPNPPGNTVLVWAHDGVNVSTWQLSVDGIDTDVSPTHGEGSEWSIPFPALTPGAHILAVRACNIAGCTSSDPLSVTVVVVPTKPTDLRIEVR